MLLQSTNCAGVLLLDCAEFYFLKLTLKLWEWNCALGSYRVYNDTSARNYALGSYHVFSATSARLHFT